jgi:hypothetical protein
MKPIAALMICLAATAAAAANAQSAVYRCGNSYSESPCPQASLVDVDDARTAAQRADARLLAANDKRLGDQMASERVTRDAADTRAAKSVRVKPAKRGHATKIKWFRP